MKRSTLRGGGLCKSDTNICGNDSRSGPCRRMSPTTPTTVYQGRSDACGPNLNLLPTGSCPGHERRAIASLMIATGGASGPSPIEKNRPRCSGVSHGFEEIRADLVSNELQALGCDSVVPFDRNDLFPAVSNKQIADDAGVLHTRKRLDRFQHAVVKVGPLRGDAEGRRGGDLHPKDPLRPESRINAIDVPQASDEQAGAREQDDRECKIRHHERAADSTGGRSARDASATLLAGGTQIAAQDHHRGRQSHQNSRE